MFGDNTLCADGGVRNGVIINNKLNGLFLGYAKIVPQLFARLLAL